MIIDHAFLASLRTDDVEEWSRKLHSYLAGAKHEMAGALLVRQGRPFAITSQRIVELRAAGCSPGGLLGQALWLGADHVLPFHTQVTAKSYEPVSDDLAYAQRLRDLAQLFGTFSLGPHLLLTPHGSVNIGDQLSPSPTLSQMERWRPISGQKRASRYRHPATGEVWSGIGRRPPSWVDKVVRTGFKRDDFTIPTQPAEMTPRGIPRGAESFFTTSLHPASTRPVNHLEEIPGSGGFEVSLDSLDVIAPLSQFVCRRDSRLGILFIDECDFVTTPRAGWIGPEALLTKQPGHLFATTYLDEPVSAITFSIVPANDRLHAGRRDLLRRLVFLGALLGVPICDHLFLYSDGPFLSSRSDRSLARRWPRLPPVGEPVWPPFLRPQQTRSTIHHPEGEETWEGRGPMPNWVRQLLEAGWSLDELRIYP